MKRTLNTMEDKIDTDDCLLIEGLTCFLDNQPPNLLSHSHRFFNLQSMPIPNRTPTNDFNHSNFLPEQQSNDTTSLENNTIQATISKTEAKRIKNRLSAKTSREKKLKQIIELEEENNHLKQEMHRLQQENWALLLDNEKLTRALSRRPLSDTDLTTVHVSESLLNHKNGPKFSP